MKISYLLRNFILILFLLYACFAIRETNAAVSCERHPIYCHIKSLKPKMKNKRVMKISNLFHKYSRVHKISNPILSVAIAMQETNFRPEKSRKQDIIVFNKEMTDWKVIRGYTDICMFQFHVGTIVKEKMDPIKLKIDLEHCIEQHFKLLKKKLRICKHLKEEAWTCYHSRTLKLRKRYKEDVEKYL